MTNVGVVALTLVAYALSLQVRKRWASPITTPALTSVIFIIAMLRLGHLPYADYAVGRQTVTAWIGPACAALGVILYKQRSILTANARIVVTGLLSGTLVTVVLSVVLAHFAQLDRGMTELLILKSVSAAIAIQFAPIMHVAPALIAVVVVGSGICGAVIGPALLDRFGLRDAIVRGIALGCISHGIGTAQAVAEGELSGAAASLAMCLMAIGMSIFGMPLIDTLLH